MRVSSISRGIRGIFPLVRTLAPQAISPPFALSALQGLRLAIDATLLVQRLHFADDPHPSRHVIGFYRLITSLRQHGIVPIMVFDHPQKRLALKDREQLKRRHKRELDRVRSRLEDERRGRLQELQSDLDALSTLHESERRQVGELLEEWRTRSTETVAEQLGEPATSTAPQAVATITPPTPSPPPPTLPSAPSRSEAVAHSLHTNWLQLQESLRSGATSQSKGQKVLAEAEQQVYQTIAMQLISGEAPRPLPSLNEIETIDSAEQPTSHPLSSLNAMHQSLTKTYARATTPLSASIYTDCAKLSTLMAVPVFWTGDGTRMGGGRIHEAEAYAASLVRSGFADLVASEDSDVLLYEAPLLRGLMGGVRSSGVLTREGARGKLEVVNGTRVRTALFSKSELDKLAHAHTNSPPPEEPSELSYDRMTRSMMLDFALLCGTDFNRTIPGIGPKTALRLLKEHGSISAILRKEAKKFAPPDGLSIKEYEAELRNARTVFLQPPKVRAAARSILGTAASEAASDSAARQVAAATVDRVLFSSIASSDLPMADEAAASSEEGAVDAESNVSCTADPAVELEIVTASTTAPTESTAALNTAEAAYDRQAVHDFLRSHGVFRSSLPESEAEEFEPKREQEWRDLLDLELGLTSPTSTTTMPTFDDLNDIIEGEFGRKEKGGLGAATLGADFFGERKAVACWNPHMEQQVRDETSAPRHTAS